MSKFDEKLELYKSSMNDLGIKFNNELFSKVAKGLGPSIYNVDAETIAGTNEKELTTVKENFLKKKLGLTDTDKLDEAIAETINKMGTSNKKKYRAVFYYILVEKFNKQSVY